jgi:hypothetical protein
LSVLLVCTVQAGKGSVRRPVNSEDEEEFELGPETFSLADQEERDMALAIERSATLARRLVAS